MTEEELKKEQQIQAINLSSRQMGDVLRGMSAHGEVEAFYLVIHTRRNEIIERLEGVGEAVFRMFANNVVNMQDNVMKAEHAVKSGLSPETTFNKNNDKPSDPPN